jgi:RecA-family ATPase
MAQLAARIMQLGARLVVVDNLGVILGGADENSAEVQGPMQALRWLTELTGAAVIILHHQRKSNGQKSREGETLRGHSSIEAKLDTALLVTRDGASVTVKPTKIRGADVQPFSASFAFEQDAVTRELTSARFWPSQPVDYQAEAERHLKNKIVEVVRQHVTLSKSKIGGYVNANRNRVFALVDMMRQDGELVCHARGQAQLYSLPASQDE